MNKKFFGVFATVIFLVLVQGSFLHANASGTYCAEVHLDKAIPPIYYEVKSTSEAEVKINARLKYPKALGINVDKGACPLYSFPKMYNTDGGNDTSTYVYQVIPASKKIRLGVWVEDDGKISNVYLAMARTNNGGDPTLTQCVNGKCGKYGTVSHVMLLDPEKHQEHKCLWVQTAVFHNPNPHDVGALIRVKYVQPVKGGCQ